MKYRSAALVRLVVLLVVGNILLSSALYLRMGPEHPYFDNMVLNFLITSVALVVIVGLVIIMNKKRQ